MGVCLDAGPAGDTERRVDGTVARLLLAWHARLRVLAVALAEAQAVEAGLPSQHVVRAGACVWTCA